MKRISCVHLLRHWQTLKILHLMKMLQIKHCFIACISPVCGLRRRRKQTIKKWQNDAWPFEWHCRSCFHFSSSSNFACHLTNISLSAAAATTTAWPFSLLIAMLQFLSFFFSFWFHSLRQYKKKRQLLMTIFLCDSLAFLLLLNSFCFPFENLCLRKRKMVNSNKFQIKRQTINSVRRERNQIV